MHVQVHWCFGENSKLQWYSGIIKLNCLLHPRATRPRCLKCVCLACKVEKKWLCHPAVYRSIQWEVWWAWKGAIQTPMKPFAWRIISGPGFWKGNQTYRDSRMLGDQTWNWYVIFLKRSSYHKCHWVGAHTGFDSLKALAWFPHSISSL